MQKKLKNDKKLIEKNWNWTKTEKHEKCKKLEKWRKCENSNEAVWDAIRTAMEPEKKFWTAEIEIYRLVISDDAFGDRKSIKMVSMFLDFGTSLSTYYCWVLIFWCFSVLGGFEKLNFAFKNNFSLKFWSKTFFCHSWPFLRKMKKWDSLKSFENK